MVKSAIAPRVMLILTDEENQFLQKLAAERSQGWRVKTRQQILRDLLTELREKLELEAQAKAEAERKAERAKFDAGIATTRAAHGLGRKIVQSADRKQAASKRKANA